MESNRVYVGNLAYSVTWYELKDFMRSAGEVVRAHVLRGPNGHSRGCGIVEFVSAAAAQQAIDTLNNEELKGRPIFVREDREPQHSSSPGSNSSSTTTNASTAAGSGASTGSGSGATAPDSAAPATSVASSAGAPASAAASAAPNHKPADSAVKSGTAIFVGNLPFTVTWQQLKHLFGTIGEVVRADVHMTPQRRSRGHGTVVYADEATAKSAIAQLNGFTLEGRVIEVREDKPASERPAAFLWCSGYGDQSDIVYVSNLPWSTTDTDLVELFQSIAPVTRAQLQNFPDGRLTGCGVVRFESQASAEQAIAQLNGYNYGSRDLHVSYARYPPPASQSS